VTGECRLLFRRMQAADLAQVARLERAAHHSPWSEDLIRRELDHEWSTVLLAFSPGDQGEEALVGHIIFWIVHDEIHILNVATDPGQRRRGCGRALMLLAEEQGLGRGAVMATLEVRQSNDPAIGLYRSLGYRQVGVRPRYYEDNGEDALIMTKTLR